MDRNEQTGGQRWMTVAQVARQLRESSGKVHGYIRDGQLLALNKHDMGNNKWIVHVEDLRLFLVERGLGELKSEEASDNHQALALEQATATDRVVPTEGEVEYRLSAPMGWARWPPRVAPNTTQEEGGENV